MIAFCTYRPAPPASHQAPSIRLRCRDFTFVAFHFLSEGKARDVYDSIRSLTCKLGRVEKLYAFSYKPQGPEREVNGWDIYDAKRELKRLGVSAKDVDKGWRISEINADYQVYIPHGLRRRCTYKIHSIRPRIQLCSLFRRQSLIMS